MSCCLNTGLVHDLNVRQMEVQFPTRTIELTHHVSKASGPAPEGTRPTLRWGLSPRSKTAGALTLTTHPLPILRQLLHIYVFMTYRRTKLRLTGTALCTSDSTFWLMHKKEKRTRKHSTARRPANTWRTSRRLLCPLPLSTMQYISLSSHYSISPDDLTICGIGRTQSNRNTVYVYGLSADTTEWYTFLSPLYIHCNLYPCDTYWLSLASHMLMA